MDHAELDFSQAAAEAAVGRDFRLLTELSKACRFNQIERKKHVLDVFQTSLPSTRQPNVRVRHRAIRCGGRAADHWLSVAK